MTTISRALSTSGRGSDRRLLPPAIYAEDVLKLIGALVLLQQAGLIHSRQPEDPALARCAGR